MSGSYRVESANASHSQIESGQPARLIDVRTAAEFHDGHARGAWSLPLQEISRDRLIELAGVDDPNATTFYLLCGSGTRARQAAWQLQQEGLRNLVVVDGGTEAWRESRLPMVRHSRLPSLERQTQIALGAMLLLVLIKGAVIHPLFYLLVGLIAAGLIYAGISARCSLTALLARMPWNRQRDGEPA